MEELFRMKNVEHFALFVLSASVQSQIFACAEIVTQSIYMDREARVLT